MTMLNGIERKSRGFTLIELLVVIAIIALLLAIILPSLNMVKELTRRVVCANKLKGFGTVLHLYSQDYRDKMMPNSNSNGGEFDKGIDSSYQPWWSYVIGNDSGDPDFLNAFNHGTLYELQYVEEPDRYYCPSAFLTLKGVGPMYTRNYYFENVVRSMPPHKGSGWGGPLRSDGKIRCRSSYSYWTWEETSFLKLTNKPVVIDSLVRIPHWKSGKPFGVVAVFGDGHANVTLVANTALEDYAKLATWAARAQNYEGFVGALEMLEP